MSKLIILTSSDFEKKRFGKAFSSQTLRIRVSYGSQNIPRFGFIIPKKAVPKVTDRNKLKRRIKSVLRAYLNEIKPIDILIFPSINSLHKSFKDLTQELKLLFNKAKILK